MSNSKIDIYKLFRISNLNNIISIRQIISQSYEISINKNIICTTEVAQKNIKVACRYI